MTQQQRRGAALMLVLATLVIVVPAAALTAARAASLKRQQDQVWLSSTIDASLPSIQSRIESWLATDAANAVLPIDVLAPRLDVETVAWQTRGQQVSMGIEAFDLRAMLAVDTARNTPLGRLALPEIHRELRSITPERVRSLGADGWSFRSDASLGDSGFPGDPSSASVGALVALDLGDDDRRHVLNANTAPWPLVEAVARASGSTSLDLIADARSAGQPVASLPVPARAESQVLRHVRLVTGSDAWAFRVVAEVQGVRRAWWLVYLQEADGWRMLRRVPIDA